MVRESFRHHHADLAPLGYPWRAITSDVVLGAPVADHDGRVPVLGFGSNQSALVLASKFALDSSPSSSVPVLLVSVSGWASAYCAVVSSNGYVAVTPHPVAGARVLATVSMLTPAQFEHLNSTEPNYTEVWLDTGITHVATGEPLEGAWMYVSDAPLLHTVEGLPVLTARDAAGSWTVTQPELFSELARHDSLAATFGGEPEKVVERLRSMYPDFSMLGAPGGL